MVSPPEPEMIAPAWSSLKRYSGERTTPVMSTLKEVPFTSSWNVPPVTFPPAITTPSEGVVNNRPSRRVRRLISVLAGSEMPMIVAWDQLPFTSTCPVSFSLRSDACTGRDASALPISSGLRPSYRDTSR